MAKLTWDAESTRYFELGVSMVALFKTDSDGNYKQGVAWNGVTSIDESPDGADVTDLYADDIKYGSIRAAENFGGTINAYAYPPEFMECDGVVKVADGVYVHQQARKPFGLVYKTKIGSDTDSELTAYKLHIVYNATVSPSDISYETINDSPDGIEFSWEFDTTPIEVTGYKPVSNIVIDSRKFATSAAKTKLQALEDKIYGTASEIPELPKPDALIALLK